MSEILNNWLLNSIKTESWRKYDDLSIARIIEAKPNKDVWLEEGLKCLLIAKDINKKIGDENKFDLALVQSLICGSHRIGVNFSSVSQLKKQMDNTPPSLYLISKDWNDWNEQIAISKKIELKGFQMYRVYYLEFKSQHDRDYRRSIWIL